MAEAFRFPSTRGLKQHGLFQRYGSAFIAAAAGIGIFAFDALAGPDTSCAILYLGPIILTGRRRRAGPAAAASIVLTFCALWLKAGSAPSMGQGTAALFAAVAAIVVASLLNRSIGEAVHEKGAEQPQDQFDSFMDTVPLLLWRADMQGRVQYYNHWYTALTGHDRADAVARQSWPEQFHPDDLAEAFEIFGRSIAAGTELHGKLRMRHANGEYRWMMFQGMPFRASDTGEVLRWYGGTVDVHEEVLAQEKVRELMTTLELRVEERTEELRRTEERYSSLFEVSNITFAEQDFSDLEPIFDTLRLEGVSDLGAHMLSNPGLHAQLSSLVRVVRVNEALASMLGLDHMRPQSTFGVDYFDPGEDLGLRQLEMAFDRRAHLEGRTTLVSTDGRHIPVHYTVNRLQDGLQISSYFDLSEQERIADLRTAAQAELARANRVATVGAVSASIAHEVNQPIASLVIDAQMGLRCMESPTPDLALAKRILERVARNADRISGIVQRTRDAIMASPRVLQSVSLNGLIAGTRELVALELRAAGIHLQVEAGDEELSVLADPVELQQVIINLVTNAADALREWQGPRIITISIHRQGQAGRIRVSDTGPGIHIDHLAQLFQPFFTTKVSGIGMGLQICRNTIEALDGDMTAANTPRGGAMFECSIPLLLSA